MIPKFSAGALALALVFSRSPERASGEPDLATVRSATARFQDVKVAIAEGYVRDPMNMCGAMGIDYFRPDLSGIEASSPRANANGTPSDLRKPAILIYDPQPDGSLQLVAVESLVFRWAWREAGHTEPPTLHGVPHDPMEDDPATRVDEAHMFVPRYDRHLWIFREKPNGVFASYNPNVSCAAHEALVAAQGGHEQGASDGEA